MGKNEIYLLIFQFTSFSIIFIGLYFIFFLLLFYNKRIFGPHERRYFHDYLITLKLEINVKPPM